MAESDNLHQYSSLSIDELYNVLFTAIKNMCDASDSKDKQLFLDRQNEVFFIKSIIEQKKAEIKGD